MLLCPHPHSRNTGRIMSVESGDDVAGTRWDAAAGSPRPWVCAATSCCFSAVFSASSSEILCVNVWSAVWSVAPATGDTTANAAATVAANRMSIAGSHRNESARKEISPV